MSSYIDNILEKSEKKNWEGKVNRKVMTVSLILWVVIGGIISYFFFRKDVIHYTSNGVPKEISGFLIGIIILCGFLVLSIWGFLADLVKEYAVTNKRVIIKSGLIGTDYQSIYFEQINQVIIDVGLIGKIFKTGNLKIDTGKTETYSTGGTRTQTGYTPTQIKTKTMYEVLKNINNPYEVYKTIQPSITGRREGLYSGRADRESNPEYYKK